jgi:PhzF family phenazine biosynthesis protein
MRLLHIDAFTSRPFTGNPAVVCLLDAPAEPGWMQSVAAEMNVSETAFVWREFSELRLRWFTPVTEVDLCGHATLAAAHAVREENWLRGSLTVRFHTRSGVLVAEYEAAGIRLEFPAVPVRRTPPHPALAEALGVTVPEVFLAGDDLLVPLPTRGAVETLRPDLARLAEVSARGVIITARGDSSTDFVSRFFAPRIGIPEDPVTGSAHCALAAYWSGPGGLRQREFVGWQASKRGGRVRVRMRGDKIHLLGTAVTVAVGELLVLGATPSEPFEPSHRREGPAAPSRVRSMRPRLQPRQTPPPP